MVDRSPFRLLLRGRDGHDGAVPRSKAHILNSSSVGLELVAGSIRRLEEDGHTPIRAMRYKQRNIRLALPSSGLSLGGPTTPRRIPASHHPQVNTCTHMTALA